MMIVKKNRNNTNIQAPCFSVLRDIQDSVDVAEEVSLAAVESEKAAQYLSCSHACSRYAPVNLQFSFFVECWTYMFVDARCIRGFMAFFHTFEGNHRVWVVLRRDFQVSEKGDNEIAGEMSEVPPCTPQFYGRSL